MMFNYRDFLMKGFRNAVGKQADYQVIFNANGFYEKGVLTEYDLAELNTLIEAKNKPELPEVTEDVPAIIPELPEDLPIDILEDVE